MTLPVTERENPKTADIDKVSTIEALRLINAEDRGVAGAVEKVLPQIGKAIDCIVERLKDGGRLFYIGTGTSGRLGVLDASEIPPTYGVSPELVQGVIAGGPDALHTATEVSEDDARAGIDDLRARGLNKSDAVIGIAASGRTPYTIGAVEYARGLGCLTVCIACVPDSEITRAAAIAIVPVVGPEAIAGSTRMKAGTAQKMVLNMISTVAMIRLGYVKGNRMTNVRSSNAKLKERGLRILMTETGSDEESAGNLMKQAGGDLRVAIVMHRTDASADEARDALAENNFAIDRAVEAMEETARNGK